MRVHFTVIHLFFGDVASEAAMFSISLLGGSLFCCPSLRSFLAHPVHFLSFSHFH